MPEENKREGVGGGGGFPPGPDLLRIHQYPDPSRPYSTESSGSSTYTQENRSRCVHYITIRLFCKMYYLV